MLIINVEVSWIITLCLLNKHDYTCHDWDEIMQLLWFDNCFISNLYLLLLDLFNGLFEGYGKLTLKGKNYLMCNWFTMIGNAMPIINGLQWVFMVHNY